MAQRGYGEPVGREWGADDDRERGEWRDRDRDRDRPYRSLDRDEDRGFFERAGEEIRSWFSDSDEEDRYERGGGRDFEHGQGRFGERHGSAFGMDRNRDFGRSDRDRGNREGRRDWEPGGAGISGSFSERDRERGYGGSGRAGRDYMSQGRTFGRSGGGADFDRGFGRSRSGGRWEGDRSRGEMQGSQMTRPGGQQGFQSEYGGRQELDRGGEERGFGYEDYSGTLGGFGNQRMGRPEDQFYLSWRERQLRDLDRDYDDYCREREQSFHQDFDEWRRNRQGNRGQSGMGDKDELQLGAPGSGTRIGKTGGSPSPDGTTSSTGTRGSSRQSGKGSAESGGNASAETSSASGATETSGGGRSGSRSRS